jgi:protein dithiol:quinone oxidoreductase
MDKNMSNRLAYFIGFIIVCLLLLTSVYLQYFDHFVPCPLCSLQRVAFALLGLFFLIGIFLHSSFWGRIIINSLLGLSAIIGIFLSGRQIWLQHFPSADNIECGVSLEYMAQVLPFKQLMQKIIIEGSAECSKRGWEFLHLNMAEWSFFWFCLFLLIVLYLFLKEFQHVK